MIHYLKKFWSSQYIQFKNVEQYCARKVYLNWILTPFHFVFKFIHNLLSNTKKSSTVTLSFFQNSSKVVKSSSYQEKKRGESQFIHYWSFTLDSENDLSLKKHLKKINEINFFSKNTLLQLELVKNTLSISILIWFLFVKELRICQCHCTNYWFENSYKVFFYTQFQSLFNLFCNISAQFTIFLSTVK